MRRIAAAVVVMVGIGLALWALTRSGGDDASGSDGDDDDDSLAAYAKHEQARLRRSGPALAPTVAAAHARDHVVVSGTVIDRRTTLPVSGVEVVLTGVEGESSTTASSSGEYSIEVPRGTYRAFVRDDTYISVGPADRVRVPHAPQADVIGVPDEARMPTIVAATDVSHLELPVLASGTITGVVTNVDGQPVARAVVEARGGEDRPVLGTQLAETDADGHFELRVPEGYYTLEASHPRYAGVDDASGVTVTPGSNASADLELGAGCVISGKVVRADGSPAPEGALDLEDGAGGSVGPAGLIEPDGSFRFTTLREGEINLRAWPWKSPPSEYKTFNCTEGARYPNTKFVIPNRDPDITGRLVDAHGNPVPFAYLDLTPEDPANIGQQERTDDQGYWHVYAMPPGRYRVEVAVSGKGVATGTVVSPSVDNQLELSGTGRIEGTTTNLANGSFIAQLDTCYDEAIQLPKETRLVSVIGGRFVIDDVPACDVRMFTVWHDRRTRANVLVERDQAAHLEIDVGPRRMKRVTGFVHDSEGRPVADAIVREATVPDDTYSGTPAVTDNTGHYEIEAVAGTTLESSNGDSRGIATVGLADVKDEQVDITLESGM
jgi:protocatechuate 3,4-dioxygenase beta subunit